MKKLLLFSMAAAISFASVAQGNSQHNKGKNKQKNEKHQPGESCNNDQSRNNDQARNDDWRNRNDRTNDRRNDDDWSNNQQGGTPRKVQDAFNRDYPDARNVTWTKDRGVWSARFKKGGLFGGTNTVSYKANGQRVNNNSNYAYNR